MKLEKHHYFFLFVIFLFLGITSVELFSDGMFMDGLLYADVSRNMAKGLGSFWKPYLTDGLYSEFYEHPPLMFGLQSIFFKLFGDSIYVERMYSLLAYVIVGYLTVLIWGKFTKDKKNGWIPLFLLFSTSGITWAVANNMLENTMSIFVGLSVLFYLNSYGKKRFLWIALSGGALSLGLLTKGFFCLYIWGVPFFMWVFMRKRNFAQMVMDTFIMVAFTVLPIVLLFFLVPEAQNNMLSYFNKQILYSLQNVNTVDTRFAIVGYFFSSISIPIVVGIIIIIVGVKQNIQTSLFKVNVSVFFMFLAIALSGVIPIMISMKQSSFYILTVYPLFAVGLAYYLYPIIKSILDNLKIGNQQSKICKRITIGVVVLSIVLSVSQINRVGRDKELIFDTKAVIKVVGKNTTISACEEMYPIWSLHGYLSRYGNVSLDVNPNHIFLYYLSLDNCNKEWLEKRYDLVPIKMKKYKLYKLKEVR